MANWKPVLYNGLPLLNSSGIPKIYDADIYPSGPPASCCCVVPCPCCPGATPSAWDVTIGNVGNGAQVGGCCDDHNATFTIPLDINEETGEPIPCLWRLSYTACEATEISIEVGCSTEGTLVTVTVAAPTDGAVFQKLFPVDTDCFDLTGDIPLVSGGVANCDFSAPTCSIAPALAA